MRLWRKLRWRWNNLRWKTRRWFQRQKQTIDRTRYLWGRVPRDCRGKLLSEAFFAPDEIDRRWREEHKLTHDIQRRWRR